MESKMQLFTKDGDNLMTVEKLEIEGNELVIHGEIMGALPTRAVLTPDQARAGLRLLNFRTALFLLSMLFRSGRK
jgi:hypothetical protein